MLHYSITTSYDTQKNVFDRFIRLAFTAAGMYWIAIYVLQWMDLIVHNELTVLRSGQTIIYFLLLTLWGVEYMREVRRYKSVVRESIARSILPNKVTSADLGTTQRSFVILRPLTTDAQKIDARSLVMPIVNTVLLALSSVLIVKQYVDLVTASMN